MEAAVVAAAAGDEANNAMTTTTMTSSEEAILHAFRVIWSHELHYDELSFQHETEEMLRRMSKVGELMNHKHNAAFKLFLETSEPLQTATDLTAKASSKGSASSSVSPTATTSNNNNGTNGKSNSKKQQQKGGAANNNKAAVQSSTNAIDDETSSNVAALLLLESSAGTAAAANNNSNSTAGSANTTLAMRTVTISTGQPLHFPVANVPSTERQYQLLHERASLLDQLEFDSLDDYKKAELLLYQRIHSMTNRMIQYYFLDRIVSMRQGFQSYVRTTVAFAEQLRRRHAHVLLYQLAHIQPLESQFRSMQDMFHIMVDILDRLERECNKMNHGVHRRLEYLEKTSSAEGNNRNATAANSSNNEAESKKGKEAEEDDVDDNETEVDNVEKRPFYYEYVEFVKCFSELSKHMESIMLLWHDQEALYEMHQSLISNTDASEQKKVKPSKLLTNGVESESVMSKIVTTASVIGSKVKALMLALDSMNMFLCNESGARCYEMAASKGNEVDIAALYRLAGFMYDQVHFTEQYLLIPEPNEVFLKLYEVLARYERKCGMIYEYSARFREEKSFGISNMVKEAADYMYSAVKMMKVSIASWQSDDPNKSLASYQELCARAYCLLGEYVFLHGMELRRAATRIEGYPQRAFSVTEHTKILSYFGKAINNLKQGIIFWRKTIDHYSPRSHCDLRFYFILLCAKFHCFAGSSFGRAATEQKRMYIAETRAQKGECYEKAIKFIRRAIEYVDIGDIKQANRHEELSTYLARVAKVFTTMEIYQTRHHMDRVAVCKKALVYFQHALASYKAGMLHMDQGVKVIADVYFALHKCLDSLGKSLLRLCRGMAMLQDQEGQPSLDFWSYGEAMKAAEEAKDCLERENIEAAEYYLQLLRILHSVGDAKNELVLKKKASFNKLAINFYEKALMNNQLAITSLFAGKEELGKYQLALANNQYHIGESAKCLQRDIDTNIDIHHQAFVKFQQAATACEICISLAEEGKHQNSSCYHFLSQFHNLIGCIILKAKDCNDQIHAQDNTERGLNKATIMTARYVQVMNQLESAVKSMEDAIGLLDTDLVLNLGDYIVIASEYYSIAKVEIRLIESMNNSCNDYESNPDITTYYDSIREKAFASCAEAVRHCDLATEALKKNDDQGIDDHIALAGTRIKLGILHADFLEIAQSNPAGNGNNNNLLLLYKKALAAYEEVGLYESIIASDALQDEVKRIITAIAEYFLKAANTYHEAFEYLVDDLDYSFESTEIVVQMCSSAGAFYEQAGTTCRGILTLLQQKTSSVEQTSSQGGESKTLDIVDNRQLLSLVEDYRLLSLYSSRAGDASKKVADIITESEENDIISLFCEKILPQYNQAIRNLQRVISLVATSDRAKTTASERDVEYHRNLTESYYKAANAYHESAENELSSRLIHGCPPQEDDPSDSTEMVRGGNAANGNAPPNPDHLLCSAKILRDAAELYEKAIDAINARHFSNDEPETIEQIQSLLRQAEECYETGNAMSELEVMY